MECLWYLPPRLSTGQLIIKRTQREGSIGLLLKKSVAVPTLYS